MNPRHITEEELEVLALRWARSQTRRILNNVNVDCFIAGFNASNEVLRHHFGKFLLEEASYYKEEYRRNRIESCGYSGIPLTTSHTEEFKAAKEVGELLEKAARKIIDSNLLH